MPVSPAATPERLHDETGRPLSMDDFDALYAEHWSRLITVLRGDGLSPATAEDVAQEAFARCLARWGAVRRGDNPAGYVYRSAFRLARTEQRRQRRSIGSRVITSDVPSWDQPPALLDPQVARALATLSTTQRKCLLLRAVADMTLVSIAKTLHMSDKTVSVHLTRARQKIRGELTRADPG